MPETEERRGREGGRWINERPTSEEFATWFTGAMPIDSELKVEDYIGGVVLIPAVDRKAKIVTGFQNGAPVIEERPELSFVPYAKVETRVAYFWDLVAAHAEEWVAVVEQVESPRLPIDTGTVEEHIEETQEGGRARTIDRVTPAKTSGMASLVHQLPTGFSIMSVPVGDGYSHFLCCTTRVAIYNREEYREDPERAVPLRQGRGTKQVPMLGSYNTRVWADESSLMKAETGALGRALGFAGVFVIPGSGVATAEDMLEAIAQGSGNTPAEAPAELIEPEVPAAPEQAPLRTGAEAAEDETTQLRNRALELHKQLKESHPAKLSEFTEWAHSRSLRSLSDAQGAMLRGVVRKLEKMIDDADKGGEGGDTGEEAETAPAGAGEEATGDGDEPSGSASSGE